jgi:hypothetical protein
MRNLEGPFVVSILVAGVLVGCAAPAPLVGLSPVSADKVWVAGRAVVAQEQAGVHVATAFGQQAGKALALRVEIENATDGRMEVAPRDISFVTCRTEAVASCGPESPVIDPEQVMASLDQQASLEQAAATNDAALLGSLVLLSAVTDVAAVTSGHANRTTGLQTAALGGQMDANAANHTSSTQELSAQRGQWADVALRRNTLFPGHGIGGNVFVPIDLSARYVWLRLRVGNRLFQLGFRQTITEIAPPPSMATPNDKHNRG